MIERKIDKLYENYTQTRFLELNKDQFITIVNIFPALLVVLSDDILDREEWTTVKKLARIVGIEFATDEFGDEKEENLTLLYRAEFRYLLKNREIWEKEFLEALRDYFSYNASSKEFVLETMYLFSDASGGTSNNEEEKIQFLINELGIKN